MLDIEGTAWLFGRNQPAALGVPGVESISENAPRQLRATDLGAPPGTVFVNAACGRGHSVLVGSNGRVWTAGLNTLGQVKSSGYCSCRPTDVCGYLNFIVRSHALPGSQHVQARKRTSESSNWRAGARMRCSSWNHIYAVPNRNRKEHVMLVFVRRESVADGRFIVYACGSGEKGQLGNGRTGEHIATGNRTGFDVESEPSEKPTRPDPF